MACWVERGETHRLLLGHMMGIALLNPSYTVVIPLGKRALDVSTLTPSS